MNMGSVYFVDYRELKVDSPAQSFSQAGKSAMRCIGPPKITLYITLHKSLIHSQNNQ